MSTTRAKVGLLLLGTGEALIVARVRPLSDFYFPIVWLGYILLLDAAVYQQIGDSLYATKRTLFLAMFPVSALFWWLFELLNSFVNNWVYIGGQAYTGVAYVAVASLDFCSVLPAVWVSALFIKALLPQENGKLRIGATVPPWILTVMAGSGLLCLALPIIFPRYFYGLIWACAFLLLDPINHLLKRPSVIQSVWERRWQLPVSFALGALMCGFFWEAWNYWSMPKWVYTIPYVNQWHIFEMPLLGWGGYLPFGLELFAMANFVLPLFRLQPASLEVAAPSLAEEEPLRQAAF